MAFKDGRTLGVKRDVRVGRTAVTLCDFPWNFTDG